MYKPDDLKFPFSTADFRHHERASAKPAERTGYIKALGLVGCIFAALTMGCATTDPTDQTQDELGQACQLKCEKCHKGDSCSEVCYYPAHCQSTCMQFEMCIQGYQWDDRSCSCQPTQPAGETCGPSLTCHGSDHCCTAGPVSADPTLNDYFCAPATDACPL
jgi:hypothetical protein